MIPILELQIKISSFTYHAARELLLSKLEEGFHRGRSARISVDSDGPGNDTDESVISVADNEEE